MRFQAQESSDCFVVVSPSKNITYTLTKEKYEEYFFSQYQKHISATPFDIAIDSSICKLSDYYENDILLFNEFDKFIRKDWRKELLAYIETSGSKSLANELNRIIYSTDRDEVAFHKVRTFINNLQPESNHEVKEFIKTLQKKLQHFAFENCMFIAGYYGSGKTRLSLELARRSIDKCSKDKTTSTYLFVSSNCDKNLQSCIIEEFCSLFGSKHSITEYLNSFSQSNQIIIVLDDVHKYIQKGFTLKKIFEMILYYSRSYVKWIILLQPGYNLDPDKTYKQYYEKCGYIWSHSFQKYLIGQWFQLDDWNKDKDTTGKIIQKFSSADLKKWKWKEQVVSTNYYNPLFANVLLSFDCLKTDPQSVFLKNDLLFPSFCSMYYRILSSDEPSIDKATGELADVFLDTYNLSFKIKGLDAQITEAMCEELVNHGLLLRIRKDYIKYAMYTGIPSMVWSYLMAISARERWLNDDNQLMDTHIPNYDNGNKEIIHNVICMIILFVEKDVSINKDIHSIRKLWQTLWAMECEEAILESGFKSRSSVRNDLINWVIDRHCILEHNFERFLRLCALGEIHASILYKVIDFCIKVFNKEINTYGNLFVYMLRKNFESMKWKEILDVLPHLKEMQNFNIAKSIVDNIGNEIASCVVKKSEAQGNLSAAISASLKAMKGDNNRQNRFERFPSNIYDYFSEYFCDAVIALHGSEGYKKLNAHNWYTFDNNLEWYQKRRNQALTLALSYTYRNSRNIEYVKWYEDFVEDLSKGGYPERKFALYLIKHSSQKEQNYRIDPTCKLGTTALRLYDQSSPKDIFKEKSIRAFYKRNFNIDIP